MGSARQHAASIALVALLFCASLTLISGADEKSKTEFKAALADAVVCSGLDDASFDLF
jgi:hypothetical protein